jgi:3-oxoadipate enol-lactonase
MPFVESREAQIHYTLEGQHGAPALLFSNSLGTNISMWDPQAQEFGNKFSILRYDTRGHGQSSSAAGPYTIEQLSKDVLALLDALKLERVNFCGLSMGGMIGMWLGANAQQRLHKLILCNTGARIGNPEGWNTRIETVRNSGMKSVSSAVLERWFTPAFRAQSPATISNTRIMLEAVNPEGYVSCCAAVRDFDFRLELGKIHVPTLVIAGAHDPATPTVDGRFIADHVPGAHFVELNAAHLSNLEDQDRFNKEVAAFLNA